MEYNIYILKVHNSHSMNNYEKGLFCITKVDVREQEDSTYLTYSKMNVTFNVSVFIFHHILKEIPVYADFCYIIQNTYVNLDIYSFNSSTISLRYTSK